MESETGVVPSRRMGWDQQMDGTVIGVGRVPVDGQGGACHPREREAATEGDADAIDVLHASRCLFEDLATTVLRETLVRAATKTIYR